MSKVHDQPVARTPLHRLLHDLDALGRMQSNDQAPASERVIAAIGPALFEVVRGSLVEPKSHAATRRARPGQTA